MVQKRIMPKAQRGEHDSDATNAAYLAALLDLKAFGARRSRNTNKVLHVGIKLTTTRKWAEVQWPLLKEAYGIKAEIRVPIQRGPSVVKGKVAQANREPAYAIYTDDPASVKKAACRCPTVHVEGRRGRQSDSSLQRASWGWKEKLAV